ncbi:hypothetical protein [Brevibacillus sp. H7]|uniref:hypothetical protein n=1 Tax=Brevibacillus sp. H7 TaxID=3349138 RepID=UPI00381A99D0
MSVRLWKRYVVLIVIGGLLGGAGVALVSGKKLESYMLENRNLKLLKERHEEEIEGLKHSQRVAKKKLVQTIEEISVTVLDPKPHPIMEAEVIRQLEKDVIHLKGKKSDQITDIHLLLHEMFRRREYIVEGKTVEVRLKTVAIGRILHLIVTAEVKLDPP